jgi:hypothetical protein
VCARWCVAWCQSYNPPVVPRRKKKDPSATSWRGNTRVYVLCGADIVTQEAAHGPCPLALYKWLACADWLRVWRLTAAVAARVEAVGRAAQHPTARSSSLAYAVS